LKKHAPNHAMLAWATDFHSLEAGLEQWRLKIYEQAQPNESV
jgi:hypothetical protein